MRLGTRSPNEFIQNLNKTNEEIQKLFVEKIVQVTQPRLAKVMLGDSTVSEQKTFDPELIKKFYEEFLKNLSNWTIQKVSISKNEDLQRIFTKFEIKEGNYLISGHLSVQYQILVLIFDISSMLLENRYIMNGVYLPEFGSTVFPGKSIYCGWVGSHNCGDLCEVAVHL